MTREATIEIIYDGRRHVVSRALLVAGRDDTCELQVVQPLVSREHCRIEAKADGVFLEDLESHNGTWVNGDRITSVVRIRCGDRIRLGSEGAEFILARALIDGVDVADLPSETRADTLDLGDPRAVGLRARVSVRQDDAPPPDAPAPPPAVPPPLPPSPRPREPQRPAPPAVIPDCRGGVGGRPPAVSLNAPPAVAKVVAKVVAPDPPRSEARSVPSPIPPVRAAGPGVARRAVGFTLGVLTGVALVALLAVFTDFPERLERVLPRLGVRGDGDR